MPQRIVRAAFAKNSNVLREYLEAWHD